ncbi:MAG: M20/M25/M40 family metallo-hydrolase [Candidatus Eisenbacteria bacterium]|nr:M20/M25/M40 family metallo-hydrolase [Candidatus Eisenbacteria bacterium]
MLDKKEFEAELLGIFRDLIRIDTSNPPGNEAVAAKYVHDVLAKEGIPAKVLNSTPTRGSVVGRLKGSGAKRPVLLLAHLDVVPVEAERWSVKPFAAELSGGHIWGRGTLDIKNLVAMELMAMMLVKRRGLKLNRDIILAATADEEAGGAYGARWLIENHFDEISAEYVINEGGFGVVMDGKKFFLCQTAEKGICWMKVTVRGEGGHGSIPTERNPVVQMGNAISRIGQHSFPVARTPLVEKLITGLEKLNALPEGLTAQRVFTDEKCLVTHPSKLAKRLNAFVRATATPTFVKSGTKVNVIPVEAEFSVDCRLLPGASPDEMIETVKKLIGLPDVEYEILQKKPGTESRTDTELWPVLESCVKELHPDAAFVSYMSPGGTDSGFLREKGIVCYGFDPTFLTWEEVDTIHGVDERVSVENLTTGVLMLYRVLERFCT